MKKINPNSFFTFNGSWLKRSGIFFEAELSIPYHTIHHIEKFTTKDMNDPINYWISRKSVISDKKLIQYKIDEETYNRIKKNLARVDFNIPIVVNKQYNIDSEFQSDTTDSISSLEL